MLERVRTAFPEAMMLAMVVTIGQKPADQLQPFCPSARHGTFASLGLGAFTSPRVAFSYSADDLGRLVRGKDVTKVRQPQIMFFFAPPQCPVHPRMFLMPASIEEPRSLTRCNMPPGASLPSSLSGTVCGAHDLSHNSACKVLLALGEPQHLESGIEHGGVTERIIAKEN